MRVWCGADIGDGEGDDGRRSGFGVGSIMSINVLSSFPHFSFLRGRTRWYGTGLAWLECADGGESKSTYSVPTYMVVVDQQCPGLLVS